MMAQVTLTIASVSPTKNGATNGRKWTLYEVRSAEGARYATFDGAWGQHVGKAVTADVSERNRLGAFRETVAVPSNGNGARHTPAAPAPAAPDRFTVLNNKLDRALAELAVIRRHFA